MENSKEMSLAQFRLVSNVMPYLSNYSNKNSIRFKIKRGPLFNKANIKNGNNVIIKNKEKLSSNFNFDTHSKLNDRIEIENIIKSNKNISGIYLSGNQNFGKDQNQDNKLSRILHNNSISSTKLCTESEKAELKTRENPSSNFLEIEDDSNQNMVKTDSGLNQQNENEKVIEKEAVTLPKLSREKKMEFPHSLPLINSRQTILIPTQSHKLYTQKQSTIPKLKLDKSKKHQNQTKVNEEEKKSIKTSNKKKNQNNININVNSLTETEHQIYGNRFPERYKKIRLLGKGGFALVWLAKNIETLDYVALKQFSKTVNSPNSLAYLSANNELKICRYLSQSNPEEYKNNKFLCKYIDSISDQKDIWIAYDLGGNSLSKELFEIKGEFYNNERIYKVNHLAFYEKMKNNILYLKQLLKQVLLALEFLSKSMVIHSDLKTENILIEYDDNGLISAKLIDFGSAFILDDDSNFIVTSPEYLPPEFHIFITLKQEKRSSKHFSRIIEPWSIDIWSLGTIFLEIITGFPIWLNMKSRAIINNKSVFSCGLFAVTGKDSRKIIEKQKEVLSDIRQVLKKYSSISLDDEGIDLLNRMLDFNPQTRISPSDALVHPFLAQI